MNNDSLMRRIASATEGTRTLSAAKLAPENGAGTAPAAPLPAPGILDRSAINAPQGPSSSASYEGEERRKSTTLPRSLPQQQSGGSVSGQTVASALGSPAQPAPAPHPAAPEPATEALLHTAAEQTIEVLETLEQAVQVQSSVPEGAVSFLANADEANSHTLVSAGEMTGVKVGELVSCDGTDAIVRGANDVDLEAISVGEMVVMPVGENRIIGLVYQLDNVHRPDGDSHMEVKIELQGEIRVANGRSKFSKGIANYPCMGAVAQKIGHSDLAALYAASGNNNAVVGNLSQSEDIPAYINIEHMLSKHFAVLGATGSGKSCSVSLLLRASLEVIPDLRMILLDPHNEYSCAFPEANSIDTESLELPFWLFQLEEYAEVLFRGQPIVSEEVEALREIIPEAKQRFRDGEERTSLRSDSSSAALTADSPVPFRISDLLAIIDGEIGHLESRFARATLKSLKLRIVAHCNDPRYRFMFRDKTISDKADETLDVFFNLTAQSASMTILQMAGMPSEVVNAVASVLCRLAFEMCIAAKGKLKVLMVCEEAHRYVPADLNGGFGPTRRAIARIAKEGRKYGSFIAIISQRPAELDPTILSQCSTVFSMRLSNEHDQILIRKAISNSSKSTISFLSSLANREAIAFGEGLTTPMRLKFRTMPAQWLPGQNIGAFDPANQVDPRMDMRGVFRQWRGVNGISQGG